MLPLSAAFLISFGVTMSAFAHWPGAEPSRLAWAAGVSALLGAAMGTGAAWFSHWGSRFQILTPWCITALILVPWCLALAPYVWGGVSWWFSGSVALALLLALPLSALWHARRCTPLQPKRRTVWPGTSLRLRDATVHPPEATLDTSFISPRHAVLLCIPAFAALKAFMPPSGVAIFAFLLGLVGSLVLVCWPLGRALGQGWRLRQIEREMGVRFVHIHRVMADGKLGGPEAAR